MVNTPLIRPAISGGVALGGVARIPMIICINLVCFLKGLAFMANEITVRRPFLKLTASLHLKHDGWKDDPFLLGTPIFRG